MPYATRSVLLLSWLLLLTCPELAHADWRLSPDTKALIASAEAGDSEAQYRVGSAFDSGTGAPRSKKKALKYYLMAAEQGHAEAQNSVGSGFQAEKRYAEALVWYEHAAAQGHALATNNLGLLYDLGLGVKQDRLKGFELYSRAADLGWAESMWNIAKMYGAGQLGEIDLGSACIWIMRARRYADPQDQRLQGELTRIVPYLERTLSSKDMAECKQQSDEWAPRFDAQQGVPGDAPQAARP